MQHDVSVALDETVRAVRARIGTTPNVGVVLGSGLGSFAERLRNVVEVPFDTLPHLPVPTVPGHAGVMCFGSVDDVEVLCLKGRVHLYERVPAWQVVHAVRVMARLGVRSALVTQAAAALDPAWSLGALMAVTDHLTFTQHESLADMPEHALQRTFPDMRTAYDPGLREELHEAARAENSLSARISGRSANVDVHEGIYGCVPDPTYETPAQLRMLHALGASAIGSSTVPEVVALRQMGVRVAALACIARRAGEPMPPGDDEDRRAGITYFERVVRGWVVRVDRL